MTGSIQATPTATVERIANPSRDEFLENFVSKGRPVVLVGAMDDWSALSEWTPNQLRTRVGSRQVTVTRRPDGVYRKADHVQMSLSEYLDIVEDADRRELYYMNGLTLNQHLPELRGDFTAPQFLNPEWADDLHVWLGYTSRTICHFHSHHEAVLCQVTGEKRVLLYAPSDTGAMYPKGFFADQHNCSFVDLHDPDFKKYPKFRKATPIECVLHPGEMLFIPIHWWHGVYGLDLSISGTFFWRASIRNWHFPVPGFRCGVHRVLSYVPWLRKLLPRSWRIAA